MKKYIIALLLITPIITRTEIPAEPYLGTDEVCTPIVLVHGIISNDYTMEPIKRYIKKYLPNTYVTSIEIGSNALSSFWNIHAQCSWFAEKILLDPNLREGCTIIAHSQAGLIARYFVQHYNHPRVYNYIGLGVPQRGIFGTPTHIDELFSWFNYLEESAHKLMYSPFFQTCFSVAGYWNDPLHHQDYLTKCTFLPYLNNEVDHPLAELYKENLCSLDNLVLVQSRVDSIIEPRESCHFGFYQHNSRYDIEDLYASELYQKDVLGLQELDISGRLHLLFAHCSHLNFQKDEENFINNILPFLIHQCCEE